MNSELIKNNYIVIPNFISSYRANKLFEEFKEYCNSNNAKLELNDLQAPLSKCCLNYISFLEILCEKTPEVSQILEETVLPTYSYARVYNNGSILTPHTDRDACEISLSLHLGGDRSWPIWIKSSEEKNQCVNLTPGDAVLYFGKIAKHWRDEYAGEEYVQVFLHYVKSRGNFSYAYFDNPKDLDKNIFLEEENITNKNEQLSKKNKCNKELDLTPLDKFNSSKTGDKSSLIIVKPTNTLEDFIQVFDNVLSPENCNLILNEYQNSSEWLDTRTGDGKVSKHARNCTVIPISEKDILEQNFDVRKNLDDVVFESVRNIITNYNNLIPTFNIDIDTGYELLRYKEGEFYIQHTDSFKEQQRSLSCSIQLNEDYEGGEFAFFDREIMIRTKPGSAIVFPSNFMYPHEIMPVIKGTRYSIITWLV